MLNSTPNTTIYRFAAFFILLVAILLRIWKIWEAGFSHDEFSALFRTNFSDFNTFIEKGVKADTHPPGIQFFLWIWTDWFGTVEWLVKLPFVISGIAIVILSYSIAKLLFGQGTALWTMAFIAVVQIAVLQSQQARPYSPGMCFVLLSTWAYLKYRIHRNSNWLYLFLAGLVLSAYSHYFSLLQAAILFMIAFSFSPKEYKRKIFLAGLAAVVLFFPAITVFLFQLSKGGIGSILGVPDWVFFGHYLGTLSHFSLIFQAVLILMIIYSLIKLPSRKGIRSDYVQVVLLAILPPLIGTIYSYSMQPVLMERSLFFSMPFLVMMLFSGASENRRAVVLTGCFLILTTGIYSLVFERYHYDIPFESGYREVLREGTEIAQSASVDVYLSGPQEIWQHEARNLGTDLNDVNILTDSIAIDQWYEALNTGSGPIALGRSMHFDYPSPAFDALALLKGKGLKRQSNWFNADLRTFEPGPVGEDVRIIPLSSSAGAQWQVQNTGSEGYPVVFSEGQEWGMNVRIALNQYLNHPNNELAVALEYEADTIPEGLELVSELWKGDKLKHSSYVKAEDFGAQYMAYGVKLSDIGPHPEELEWKVYLWNKGKQPFKVKHAIAVILPGNPYQYAWYQKIELND